MVRTNKRIGEASVYVVANRYLEQGWALDGSVFTPDRAVWTAASFGELQRDFVNRPDFGSGNFESKLRQQLANSSDAAKQLMAELLAFHVLISRTIGAPKKASIVREVLGWMQSPAPLPDDVLEAFSHGFVNPGTYYNTGRPALMEYLIRLGAHWKALPAGERASALADPWRFKAALGTLHGTGAGAQYHAILHLLFPDTFEAIVSDDHISKIVRSFARYVSDSTVDPDRQLQEIRAALTPRYGEDFDFYDPRVRPLWAQGLDQWAELTKWAARLLESPGFDDLERTYKLRAVERVPLVIKTLRAGADWASELRATLRNSDNNMTNWRSDAGFFDWVETEPEKAAAALRALWLGSESPLQRLQAFADLIRAVVPTPGDRAGLGTYLLMGTDPARLPIYKPSPFKRVMALVGRSSSTGSESERWSEALDFCDEFIAEVGERGLALRDRLDAQSLIWTVAKAKGDSRILQDWSEEDRRAFLAWRDHAAGAEESADSENDNDESEGVLDGEELAGPVSKTDWMQWAARETHLPVDYLAQLRRLLEQKGQIVLYGPPGTGKTFVAQALADALCDRDPTRTGLVQFHPSTTYEDFFEGIRPRTDADGRIHYEVRPGPLATFADLAASAPDKQFVLVIDELNRANLPKVLGELLFLLEYRDRDAFTLYRSDRPFQLPRNLWFIATMNTVDRSVAVIDSAMRRRFHFVPFYPDRPPVSEVLGSICGDSDSWVAELVAAVNIELVEDLGSRDHQLGASHFIKCERTLAGLEAVWTYTIEPLIEDQFYGQQDRVDKYRWSNVVRRHTGLIPGLPVEDTGFDAGAAQTE